MSAAPWREALRRRWRALLVVAIWGAAVAGLASSDRTGAGSAAPAAGDDEARRQFPPDKHGDLVYQGYQLFTATPLYGRRFSGNGLSCANCHLDAGRKADAAPLWAAWGMYPAYSAKFDKVVSFAERVQQCFQFSLNGLPPPLDSRELNALLAYSQWLARGRPAGEPQPGRGFPTLARTGDDPNPWRGRATYAQRCAACHGEQGQGQPTAGTGGQPYAVPPLWGWDSYNKGAGLHRVDLMAGFLKANMPLGRPDLTDQQALDLAAWIQLQERWPDPRKGWVDRWLAR